MAKPAFSKKVESFFEKNINQNIVWKNLNLFGDLD
jgi:hypothetical protein